MSRHARIPLACGALLVLSACATQALQSAPDRPDQPWAPNIASDGEILPGKRGAYGLTLPAGYALPSNGNIHVRAGASTAQIDPRRAYGLAELIDVAQSANPETRRAWNMARDAALAVGIARSTYLPQLTATVVGVFSQS